VSATNADSKARILSRDTRSNENKMSYRYRERAQLEVKVI